MKRIIAIIITSISIELTHSQNMIPNGNAFYDIRDTSVSIQEFYETVPLLEVINQELKDSLNLFVEKSIPKFDDTVGYTFTLSLQYEDQDSCYSYIYLKAHINSSLGHYYYMREYRSSYTCEKNIVTTFGCIRIDKYYVLVEIPNYFAESELGELFRRKEDVLQVRIHLLPEKMIPLWDDPRVVNLPQTQFTIKLQDYYNYVSPRCNY